MSDKTRVQISNDAAHDTFRRAEKELTQLRATIAQLLDEQQADLTKLARQQRTIEAQAARIDALEQDVWPWRM